MIRFHGPQATHLRRDGLIGDWKLKRTSETTKAMTFLDTFDWRLHKRGMELCVIQQKGKARSIALVNSEGHELVARLPGRRLPSWADELSGDGGDAAMMIAAQVAAGIKRRALLPMGKVQLKQTQIALLDDLEKTIAHISIATPIHDNGLPATQSAAAGIKPLRGYEDEVRAFLKAADIDIDDDVGQPDLLTLAAQQVGRAPLDYQSKINVPMVADDDARTAALKTLRSLMAVLEQNINPVIEDIDQDFLHHFRVACRRIREALSVFRSAFPDDRVQHFRQEFGWVTKVTNVTRDSDVYLLALDGFREQLTEGLADGLDPFETWLRRRRSSSLGAVRRALRSDRFQTLLVEFHRFLEEQEAAALTEGAARPAKQLGDKRIWKIFRRMYAGSRALTDASPEDDVHDIRKLGKKLRYGLEYFKTLYEPDDIGAVITELKALQAVLGDFNDYCVQSHDLEQFAKLIAAGQASDVPPQTLLTLGALIDILNKQRAEARIQCDVAFEQFASEANRKAYRKLFRNKAEDIEPLALDVSAEEQSLAAQETTDQAQ